MQLLSQFIRDKLIAIKRRNGGISKLAAGNSFQIKLFSVICPTKCEGSAAALLSTVPLPSTDYYYPLYHLKDPLNAGVSQFRTRGSNL